MKLNREPMAEYDLGDGKKIFLYELLQNDEVKKEKLIIGDNFSGRNPRRIKLHDTQNGIYFLYRGIKVYLQDMTIY